ncbi:MAG: VWA domain-containing protein [Acidiferrobacteraceae bacterium]
MSERNDHRLNSAELEERLDELLDAVLSIRRSAVSLAEGLAGLSAAQQRFALHWTEVIAKTNPEVAYQFADLVPRGFEQLDADGVEAWIINAMDVYDKRGMYPAIAALKDVAEFAERRNDAARAVSLEEAAPVLDLFVRGLSGRALKVLPGTEAYTDTESLFLPPRLSRFQDRSLNFALYKAMAVHLWAQGWYGTFGAASGGPSRLIESSRAVEDPDRFLKLVLVLESVRIEARIAAEFPGLTREFAALRAAAGESLAPPEWESRLTRLRSPDATPDTSLELSSELYGEGPPGIACYLGILKPEQVAETMAARTEREKQSFRVLLARLIEEHGGKDADPDNEPRARVRRQPDASQNGRQSFEIDINGKAVVPDAEMRSLMESILQDLGDIPDDYLVPAGDGAYGTGSQPRPEDVWKGTYHEHGAHLYNEWDYRRQHYRKDWCVLREIDVHPSDEPFVDETLRKYAGLATNLRKTFEALRGENRVLRRQKHGDDVDVDALVDAYSDARTGREMSDRIYLQSHKIERNIAVLFMVDMSGSTKGWINDAERESLVLLCEALEVLGDRYAIYGFSGNTRKRCELYRIKRFDEPYSEIVKQRITGVKPQDYTRMGVTIRHMTRLLSEVEARTRLLITLSDGKPDDYDGYRGDYGIEDTRQALLEAKREGVHVFCITIDAEARDYLPHLYGHANYAVIDDVRKLPLRISDIYRHLTS